MPTKKAFQSSVLSLQSDMPYLLGRKAVPTASVASTTRPATATVQHHLDKIATTALKAKAAATATPPPSKQQQQQTPATPETFSTWRVTQPQHWSDGLVRPPTQEAAAARTRAAPSPHWGRLPPRGVAVGSAQQQQQQVLGK